jgi:HK97 family phage major capsid protein
MNKLELEKLAAEMVEKGLTKGQPERKIKFNEKVVDDKMNKFETLSKYLNALKNKDITVEKALAGGIADQGATLLPVEFVNEVIDRVVADPVSLRTKVNVMPVSSATGSVPVASAGIAMDWALSDTALNPHDMKFTAVPYTVYDLEGYTQISNNLLADSPANLFNILAAQYAKSIVKAENEAIVNGLGAASFQPLGIMAAANSIASVTTAVSGKISADEIVGLPFEVDVTWRANGCFIVPTPLMKQIRLLKNLQDGYIFVNGDITKGVPATLCGYPVIELANVGNNQSVVFGDLSQYILFDRQTMATDINTQSDTAFKNKATLVRYYERLDGKVAIPAAFVKLTLKA